MNMKALNWVPVCVCLMLSMTVISAAGDEKVKTELKPVLLVMDVQNIWMPRMAEEDRASAPEKINESIAMFRQFGLPVIRVYHSDEKRGPEIGSEPFQFPASIGITDEDVQVIKNRPSAFTGTELNDILAEQDCNAVFLCGLSATGCVLATYYGAMDRGYFSIMIDDALLSGNADHTDVIEQITSSVTLEELRDILDDPYL